ncbi:MAG: FtsQ-type POTRA domain-containing protein [Alphaproteobacteria bacterium]|jgi:cell division protein FtsQ|nr:FtsQ-type POTRA domain-containing protein [Alphaproteobacteria bacterium]MBT5860708.1 FtsQ-type POTRA domain-containing protein [Alphaproteobacteria bacterium]
MTIEGTMNPKGSHSGTTIVGVGGPELRAWRSGLPPNLVDLMVEALAAAKNAEHATVTDVLLTGRKHTSLDEIIGALAVRRGDSIAQFDRVAAKTRLDKIGWIESVSVGVGPSHQVTVDIVERTPFALWRHRGALFLIDRGGVMITDQQLGRFADLPMVVGGDAPTHTGELIDTLANQPALFARVRSAVRVEGRYWDIHLDNDVTVRLPGFGAAKAWARVARIHDIQGIIDRQPVNAQVG